MPRKMSGYTLLDSLRCLGYLTGVSMELDELLLGCGDFFLAFLQVSHMDSSLPLFCIAKCL
ncbi:hypothetical protein Syun_019604 [Stephania yunnanensis]|uniref:Uncharacterized protein n=1 Tax=Stephania yunnanensis TaxID=152371 RepID=A0AAP0NW16_9MAGN